MNCDAPTEYITEGGRRMVTICGDKVYIDTKVKK